MPATYAVVDVRDELAGASVERDEPLGTKEKFWFRRGGVDRWLFKYRRPGTGEDWAERIAAEVATLLRVPHAQVELATFDSERGVVVRDFTLGGHEPLVHGNELLAELDPAYPRTDYFRVREHSVESIARALGTLWWAPDESLPSGVDSALGVFIGYLLLDAVIANTDRHHENWGAQELARGPDGRRLAVLAPSYDHASSLGRELSPDARDRKFRKRGGGYDIAKYLGKARSAIYGAPTDLLPLSPLDAFRAFALLAPGAADAWLVELEALDAGQLDAVVDAVPGPTMSLPEREFARALLGHTRLALLETYRG